MRRPVADRPASAVIGLLLLAAGAAVIDWRFDLAGVWNRIETDEVNTTVEADWFAWAALAAAVVLAVLALWWLIARLPRPTEGRVALAATGSDRIDLDVRSVAPRLRTDLERNAPVDRVTSRRFEIRGGQLVSLHAHVDPRADGASLINAANAITESVATAFPDGEVTVRVIVDGPKRAKARRTPRVH
ncbi:hypothetical protein [Glycomyces algeriensis]|uniref:Alkaline shock response membrane anchor protein AmaP n=1 Tax=Glycomyces algeriensis TaxID=256037 RepID=A0A9W6LHS1_9ACTN|nr:hypothetical protein [Glycomyces algeriensis]MDA1365474.1 hypothetical protein [Glycomyces algeriensis]MDR7351160.1 signal transduction histidine kinase [Glycomyces algeriensis]GLI43873.1 hypothetical protein GALLR39Z86_37230 [Glycomyces algeriensis]